MSEQESKRKMSMVVMSGDFDKLFGAFIIANGAAAMGQEVTMFFTFWGLRAIKKNVSTGKGVVDTLTAQAWSLWGRRVLKRLPDRTHHLWVRGYPLWPQSPCRRL